MSQFGSRQSGFFGGGSGSGSVYGIDSVLSVNQPLSATQGIDFNSHSLEFYDSTQLVQTFASFSYSGCILGANQDSFLQTSALGTTTIGAIDLAFVGATLESNTAGASSGEYLVITLNGEQFKIELFEIS
jgi:hypothetical protein